MLKWLKAALSEPGTGEPSSKRLLFTLAVVCCLSFSGGAIWAAKGMDNVVSELLKAVLYATAGAYGVARFAESKGSSDDK